MSWKIKLNINKVSGPLLQLIDTIDMWDHGLC